MSATDDLIRVLKKLRLSGVLQSLDLRIRQALEDNLSNT
ncbi:MAG: transposase, partial [Planctomycetes bacterium]|nr:transposase [Planctomycetota bacterium]